MKREIKKALYGKVEFRTSESSEGKRIVEAIIPYNSKSLDLGGFREVITDTAFERTLNDGSNVYAYFNHDDNKILGSTKAGTLALRSEADALHARLELGNTSFACDCWDIISRGDCTNLSFAFIPYQTENRGNLRYLKSVCLKEISFCVSQPAYPETNSIAYTRNKKENKTMKNSFITRSVDIEKLAELFGGGELISDLEAVKEILSFIDPEALKKLSPQADEKPEADGGGGKEEEKENKGGGQEISEKEKEELLKDIEEELQKNIELQDGEPEPEGDPEKEKG